MVISLLCQPWRFSLQSRLQSWWCLPLPGLPGKAVIINTVFDYLTESPKERKLPDFLYHLIRLSAEITMPCKSYKIIFERLYQALSSVPPEMEPVVWANIDNLMQTAPEGCGLDEQCPSTPFNYTRVCAGVNSYPLQHHLHMGNMTEVLCNFSLEQYACSQLKDFTAEHLVSLLKCKLPGNSSHSKETWKVLLTKLTSVLDQALDMFSNMSKPVIGPALSQVLDVIGEIRVNRLTEDQLRDIDVIRKWFSGRLRLFLPSASGAFLHCLSTKNLSCDTYQQILREFSNQFDQMDQMRQELVVKYFIQPFLTKNSSDSGCVSNSNSSVDWLQKNLGPFSVLVSLRDLLEFNTDFSPLSVLEVLSPKQTAELLVLPLPGLPGKAVIINTVFDYLSMSPKERKLPEFLYYLVRLSEEMMLPCDSFKTIFERLYQALPSVPPEMEPVIQAIIDNLMQTAPADCLPMNMKCPITPANDSRVCEGNASDSLQSYLATSNTANVPCNFSLEEYACASLTNFTAEHLVSLLKCKLPGNSSHSKETWKVLLTKLTSVLDQALDMFSNMSKPVIGPAVSQALDVIGEIRVNRLTDDQLRDSDVIRKWFSGRLRLFLPSASGGFLHCLSTKNLSCDTYQQILREFSNQFDQMDQKRQELVVKYFIQPFLTKNSSDSGCVSNSNSSVDWLQKNLGRFSVLLSLSDLLKLNTDFSPLSALEVLSPKQTAELVVLPLPGLPGKDVIINTVFDYLSKSPRERKLPEFLYHLSRLSVVTPVGCPVYQTIFVRLYQAMSALPQEMEPIIWASVYDLTESAPMDCALVPVNQQCPVSSHNATRICASVDSSSLQQLLDSGISTGRLCDFSIKQYACSQLKDLTAENLVTLLKCKLSENNTYSKETWKLFFTKASAVLDQALVLLSNQSEPVIGPALSQVLDVIGEIRVNRLTEDQLRDSVVIRKLFSGHLRPFLPSASEGFLHCLSTKNLSCDTYQQILREFSNQFDQMDQKRQELVVKYFIQPFLTKNSSDSGCVSNSNSSVDWLQKNLGRFSVLLSLSDLLKLNTDFSPLSALEVLSPKQTAELVVLPLPGLPGKDVIINTVFDYLSKSPRERKLPEFLYHLSRLSVVTPVGCPVYQTIFVRLYQAMSALPQEMEPIIWASVYDLTESAPMDCALVPVNQQCPVSSHNATRICASVDSSSLQQLLDSGISTGRLCDFSIKQYACSQLKDLTAENLVTLLKCKLSENNTYSKETWKLFFTKASAVLDQALVLLSNQSEPVIGPALSQVLDVIGEIRVNRLTEDQLRDSVVIRKLFSGHLRPFLPSASEGFLHCLSTKNLSCDSYQAVVKEFGAQFDHMTLEQQQLVLKKLVIPFLSRPTTDSGCVYNSNSSVDWLQKNLGPFSVLVSLRDLLEFNTDFSPLSVLEVLSPKQTAELVVLPLPGLPGKAVIINTVFDYLSKSPKERKLPEFLYYLVRLSEEMMLPCDSFKTIFERLYQALPSVPPEMEPVIQAIIDNLMQTAPADCLPMNMKCPITPANVSRVCEGNASDSLQSYLATSNTANVPCNFSLEEYACASLTNFTAEHLVSLLKCKLPGNSSHSKETWKVLLTKLTSVLDQALDMFSNMSKPVIGPAVSQALDVIGEIRVNRLTDDQLRDSDVIRKWFSGRLRLFLPSASGGFLHCLSTKNLSCDTYQQILREFSNQIDQMDQKRQELVVKYFIQPFLTKNSSDSGCVSNSNSSVDWLQKNLGRFSVLLSLSDLLKLNTDFSPLSALEVLSPKQTAELVVLPLPGLPGKDVIINTVFDYLSKSPRERKLPEFLYHLSRLSVVTPVGCPVYQTIFVRLYQAMSALPQEMEPIIWASVYDLTESAPMDCALVPVNQQCPVSSHNATRICASVDSSSLQQLLDSGISTGRLCDFSIKQYACSQLKDLTAENLVTLLKCKLSENNTYSKETWKLFFTKASAVLDQALVLLSPTRYV
ncbi:uncharacterized protein [Salmo salar]|uniref:Uncharacterized protein n=1 Tax=Salmo salar TaxID=8030 RepID=A0ABM3CN73_SALSA|nr:uncharacterized protein LOC106564110 [Salmo salar]